MANTVVVGQKVHAKIETYGKVSVDTGSIRWLQPTGGNVVQDYVTNENVGQVTTLEQHYNKSNGYYCNADLEFYYVSNEYNYCNYGYSCNLGGLSALLNVTDINGKHYTDHPANSTYYIVAPTVNWYYSEWANWPGTNETPVGVRPFQANGDIELMLGGTPKDQSFSAGITWKANVTAPAVIGGGQIAYVQLVHGLYEGYTNGVRKGESGYLDGNKFVLDTSFPYNHQQVSVDTILVSEANVTWP